MVGRAGVQECRTEAVKLVGEEFEHGVDPWGWLLHSWASLATGVVVDGTPRWWQYNRWVAVVCSLNGAC